MTRLEGIATFCQYTIFCQGRPFEGMTRLEGIATGGGFNIKRVNRLFEGMTRLEGIATFFRGSRPKKR